jgi:hypothetical protein
MPHKDDRTISHGGAGHHLLLPEGKFLLLVFGDEGHRYSSEVLARPKTKLVAGPRR